MESHCLLSSWFLWRHQLLIWWASPARGKWLLSCWFFSVFHHFEGSVSRYESLWVYPTWNLWSFLVGEMKVFHRIWKCLAIIPPDNLAAPFCPRLVLSVSPCSAGSPRPLRPCLFPVSSFPLFLALDKLENKWLIFTATGSFFCLVVSAIKTLRWILESSYYILQFKNFFGFFKSCFLCLYYYSLFDEASFSYFSWVLETQRFKRFAPWVQCLSFLGDSSSWLLFLMSGSYFYVSLHVS